jgi:hypothetical protein
VALTLLWVLRELDQAHVIEIRRREDGSWAAVDAVKELDRELAAEGTQLWVAELRRPPWPPFGVPTGGRSGSTKAASTPA